MHKEDSADEGSVADTLNEEQLPEDGLLRGAETPAGWEDSFI